MPCATIMHVWDNLRKWKRRRLSPAQQIMQLVASRREIVHAFEIERRRIERDLHDGAQQYFVAENMAIGEALLMLHMYAGQLPEPLRDLPMVLERAQRVGEQGLAALRTTVNNIHPKILSDLGLEEAIKLAAQVSIADVRVITPHPLPEMPEGVIATAYFFTTEALTNCAKYAPEAHVSILLVCDQALHVSVVDDGPGGAQILSGHGLAGLRERLEAFGGELRMESPIGGPTTVVASIPLLLFPGETAIGTPRSDNFGGSRGSVGTGGTGDYYGGDGNNSKSDGSASGNASSRDSGSASTDASGRGSSGARGSVSGISRAGSGANVSGSTNTSSDASDPRRVSGSSGAYDSSAYGQHGDSAYPRYPIQPDRSDHSAHSSQPSCSAPSSYLSNADCSSQSGLFAHSGEPSASNNPSPSQPSNLSPNQSSSPSANLQQYPGSCPPFTDDGSSHLHKRTQPAIPPSTERPPL